MLRGERGARHERSRPARGRRRRRRRRPRARRGGRRLLALERGPLSSPHYVGVEGSLDVLGGLLDRAGADAGIATDGGPVTELAQLLMAGLDLPSEVGRLPYGRRRPRLVGEVDRRQRHVRDPPRRHGAGLGRGRRLRHRDQLRRNRARRPSRALSGPGRDHGRLGRRLRRRLAAVSAAARSEDGRGAKTTLEQAVPAYFGLSTPTELAEAIHRGRIQQKRLGELPPVVFAEAAHDAVASEIVARLADEVVALARVALERLDLTATPVEVSSAAGSSAATARSRPRSSPGSESSAQGSPSTTPSRPRSSAPFSSVSTSSVRAPKPSRGPAPSWATSRRQRWKDEMADVRFEQVEQDLPGQRGARRRRARPAHHRWRADGARRSVRVGKDDRPADARRPRGARRRRDLHRRARRHLRPAEEARRLDGLPELRALPVHDRGPEHRLPAEDREGRRRGASARARGRRDARTSPRSSSGDPASCPAASASAWRWGARSCASRVCS